MQWQQPSRDCAERGSASLLAVTMIAVLLAITVGACYVGSAMIARHRAQAAADLAALAAAAGLAAGADEACAQATAVADAMRAVLAGCVVDGLDVVVTVDVRVALAVAGADSAQASARAGPVDVTG